MSSLGRQMYKRFYGISRLTDGLLLLPLQSSCGGGPAAATSARWCSGGGASDGALFEKFKLQPRPAHVEPVTHKQIYDGQDPAPLFLDGRVAYLLKGLTRPDHEKIFGGRTTKLWGPPKIQFLTDDELNNVRMKMSKKAFYLMRMPPVMRATTSDAAVICRDPALAASFQEKIVFTDISEGAVDKKRLIVVREPDGDLRHATNDERHRMNYIYNPIKGRSMTMPLLFTETYLKTALENRHYNFVLDRACLQFEPDSPVFQSVAATTYDAVDDSKNYDDLCSTRHYGPMAFYLVWHRKMEGMMLHALNSARVGEAIRLAKLHTLLHPDSTSASKANQEYIRDPLQWVQIYVSSSDCSDRASLELALQVLIDELRSRAEHRQSVAADTGAAE